VVAVLLLAASVWAAEDAHKGPAAPASPAAPSEFVERQNTLAEMWQRGVIPPDRQSFTPAEREVLAEMRQSEVSGAIRYLKNRGPIGGLVVEMRTKEGKFARLTKAGYERWRLLRTQEALDFFQSKDIGAKDAFQLKDLEGRALFGKDGKLSPRGQTVYNLIITNTEAHWVLPNGQILGNRPPPKKK
jgi:hypothetical protein